MTEYPRLPYTELSASAFAGFIQVRKAVAKAGNVNPEWVAMLELRVSQLNGCSYCLHLHSQELKHLGVSEQKIHELGGWQCSQLFSAAEKTALAWADSLTQITQTHVAQAEFVAMKLHFSDAAISDMSMIISNMNAMNRVGIAMRSV